MSHAVAPLPPTPAPSIGACRFGRFVLEPAERLLLADGQPVALGARAFDLLVALVGRAGRLVSKQELLEQVWPGLVVEENNLQVQASSLRKLLGSSALATIPGRGYRFDLPVEQAEPVASAPSPGHPEPTTVPAPPPKAEPAREEATALPAPERTRTNVPARLPSLYGRGTEVDAVKALVARHVVVTVAGAGGIGKTRLAQAVAGQLAAERANDFPDGVWWVDLAPVTDGALVPSAVARVLATPLDSERSPLEKLAAILAPLRQLLVLDNCEHVADEVAELLDAVCAAAPGLRVLVTSQETLKAQDEHVFRLGALALPPAQVTDELPPSGAVDLFAARARAVAPRFAVTPDNAQAVVEICRRLDGIPLAIELAAARIPLLGVEGLRSRLGERFNVLTGGARVVLRRHQTLRATLEWSHGLLTADEQKVFRRLGVFAGSFTLEAAQYVAQDDGIDGWAALDHLGALVDKSLVLAEGDPVPRYRLLETTRAYALERLGEAGETERTLRRHAEALLERLVAIDADITAGNLKPGPAEIALASELDNLRAALAWVAGADDGGELAIALVAHSNRVWGVCHQLHEGLQRGLGVAGRIHDGMPPSLVARFWAANANLGLYTTRRDAYDAGVRAVTLYRMLDEPSQLFHALVRTAVLGYRFATPDEVGALIAEAEGLVRPDWPLRRRSNLEFARSRWLSGLGRYEEALAAAQLQVSINAASGNALGSLYSMSNVVGAEIELGRYETALAHARESIARLHAMGGTAASGAGHLWLGAMVAEMFLGRTEAALQSARTAYALLLREGDELRLFWSMALCAARSDKLADAARVTGFVEAALARAGVAREAHLRIYDLLQAAFAGLNPSELARLRAEGAGMRQEDVVRLVLG